MMDAVSGALISYSPKWGKRFDQSEIPTVAYVKERPVVYDGNRRVLIGKIIHGYVEVENYPNFSNFDFPEEIPCNVCDKETALDHVDRKHVGDGSWRPLERDIFKNKHMGEAKSPFLILDEATNIISRNPDLNRRFVKEEVFDQTHLSQLGFSTYSGKLETNYSEPTQAKKVLLKVRELVESKEISTRKNRGKILNVLKQDEDIRQILDNQSSGFKPFSTVISGPQKSIRKTSVTKGKSHNLFGGQTLQLEKGIVNNLYSDLLKIYEGKKKYSKDFHMIIRMGLRLICEAASNDSPHKLDDYINNSFTEANRKLNQDEKTTLSDQGLTKRVLKNSYIRVHTYIRQAIIKRKQ